MRIVVKRSAVLAKKLANVGSTLVLEPLNIVLNLDSRGQFGKLAAASSSLLFTKLMACLF